MKSPAELRLVLRRQWENRAQREFRLLGMEGAWPFVVPIGRPSPSMISADLDAVKRHVAAWRGVKVGEVVWREVRYRAADAPVEVPIGWKIRKPSEWIDACAEPSVRHEFDCLAALVEQVDPIFHCLLIRRRSLWRGKPLAEVVQATRLSNALQPGAANGKPLRTLSVEGIDTKFFERHAHLVTALLDVRFDGEVSLLGLETFLGAHCEGDHWLLVIDLDGSLLSFRTQRVRSSELRDSMMPGKRVLIVENESCQHLLPSIPETVAVLGAGFDLQWTRADWLADKQVAYWGDIDTWGLRFLADARTMIGSVDAVMMTSEIYQQFTESAVPEPVVAGTELPAGLTPAERDLYARLLKEKHGRLEQEFLPEPLVHHFLLKWASAPEP